MNFAHSNKSVLKLPWNKLNLLLSLSLLHPEIDHGTCVRLVVGGRPVDGERMMVVVVVGS